MMSLTLAPYYPEADRHPGRSIMDEEITPGNLFQPQERRKQCPYSGGLDGVVFVRQFTRWDYANDVASPPLRVFAVQLATLGLSGIDLPEQSMPLGIWLE